MTEPLTILPTDALRGLRTLADDSVQVALTSPPFYLLRRCGAAADWPDGWHGELGHEPTPNGFVRHLLDVFDEVWRVLKDDGCLWVNLADTYNNRQGKRGTTNAPDGCNGRFAAGGRGYAGSVWQTATILTDSDPGPAGLWQINPEASPYRHVAMWPRALVRQMLLPTTRPGDTILDPFAGSGTTGAVAVDLGLNAVLIETSPAAQDALEDRLGRVNLASGLLAGTP